MSLNDRHEQTRDLFSGSNCSRRLFLRQVLAIGAAGLVGPGLLMACSSENTAERARGEAAASGKCEGNAELPAADIAARQAVNYVDEAPHADKNCANCRFFKQPAAGAACGGCEIIKGPIAAEGYCNAWVA